MEASTMDSVMRRMFTPQPCQPPAQHQNIEKIQTHFRPFSTFLLFYNYPTCIHLGATSNIGINIFSVFSFPMNKVCFHLFSATKYRKYLDLKPFRICYSVSINLLCMNSTQFNTKYME